MLKVLNNFSFLRNLLLLVMPYLMMTAVNEIVRVTSENQPYHIYGVNTINSSFGMKDKCSWRCHNETSFCKENHVGFCKDYLEYTDPIYFGVINLLKSTGNYGLANLVFLVVLFPFLMYVFLVGSMDIQIKINRIKKNHYE